MNKKKLTAQGFTLIELLVVVAIIGILASLIMANLVGIRQRARDAQRKSDIRQIQSAVELYRSDVGSYPTTVQYPACNTSLTANSTTYMKAIPCDPLNTTTPYSYTSNGTTYSLIACLENGSDSQKDGTNVAPCNGTSNYSFTVTNP